MRELGDSGALQAIRSSRHRVAVSAASLGASILLLGASGAAQSVAAPPARPPRFEQSLAIDFSNIGYLSASQIPGGWAVGVAHRLWFAPGIGTVLGFRWVNGPYIPSNNRAEAFASVGLAPRIGVWRPFVGLELGLSAANHDRYLSRISPESDVHQWGNISPFYVAFAADPLRLRFGHVGLAALGLTVGTPVPEPGRAFRYQLTLLRLEWTF